MIDIDSGGNQAEADDDAISESTIQGERILFPHLPTYKFDQELKADENDNIYKEYFNSLSVLMKNYNWSQDLFNKLSRNIKLVHDKYVPGDAFNRKRCYDLNFWLYDQVFNKLKSTSEYDTKFFKDTSTRLQEVWKNIVDAKFKGQAFECYPDKDLLLNMGYLQEIKDLLDFFEDYNEMKNEIINNTYNGCRRYVNYLKQRIPVYYAWRDSCEVKEFACKRYIDDYMKYRPSSIVPKLSPLIVVMYAYTPCYKSVYDVFVKAKLQPKRNDGIYKKKIEKLERLYPGENLLLTDMGDGLRGSEFFIPGDHDSYWFRRMWGLYNTIVYKFSPLMLGIFGVLLILLALYKFTPLGKTARRTRAKVKKRLTPNINYDDIKLLYRSEESLNNSTDDDDDSDSSNSYNLSYASSLDY